MFCPENKSEERARDILEDLLQTQKLAVLATQSADGTYTSLVAFAPSPDRKHIAFATRRDTAKYENLCQNPRASVMLDNRSEAGEELEQIRAVTISGVTNEATGDARDRLADLLLNRHPELEDFLASRTCALLTLRIERCHVVSGFQSAGEFQANI